MTASKGHRTGEKAGVGYRVAVRDRAWEWGCSRWRQRRWPAWRRWRCTRRCRWAGDSLGFIILVAGSLVIGPWVCGSLVREDDPDPKRAVWDEVAGVWLTCLFLPKTLPWLAAAFVVFRVLDVLKPWPIRRFERLPGGCGIMARRCRRRGRGSSRAEPGAAGVVVK